MRNYTDLNLEEFFDVLKSENINPIIVSDFKNTFNKDLGQKNIDCNLLYFDLEIRNNQIEVICEENNDNSVTIYVLVENIDSPEPSFDFEAYYGEDWHFQSMYC